ncbi:MAG TPA: DnaJ domain-containing protein, partial [Candidatus Binatus sp.]|nr:DnaJ domain-containing protein [Candidatus Binatus sp.]
MATAGVEFQDYYKTLGVAKTASQAEIKKAYRKLAREWHPDRRPGDTAAERRFKELNEANAVLSDPSKREKYDRFGRDWEAYARAGAAAGAAGHGDPFGPGGPFAAYGFGGPGGGTRSGTGPGGIRYEFRTSGDPGAFSDFFRMMFGDEGAASAREHGGEPEAFSGGTRYGGSSGSLDEILAGMGMAGGAGGGRGGARAAGVPRLAPVEATAELTLEEAFHGTSRIVEVGGKRLEVSIPRGVDSGSRVRLSGKGPDGRDLVVVTRLRPHPIFKRHGADLEREVPISLEEALLGGEVRVGTLKGQVLLKVP